MPATATDALGAAVNACVGALCSTVGRTTEEWLRGRSPSAATLGSTAVADATGQLARATTTLSPDELLDLAAAAGAVALARSGRLPDLRSDPDPVRRTAQVQVASVEADAEAARLGLAATLVLEGDSAVVQLQGPAGPQAPVLQLVHPLESSLDRVLALSPGPQGWRTDGPVAAPHGWQLRLQAADGGWRLVGRYRPGDEEVALAPALDGP